MRDLYEKRLDYEIRWKAIRDYQLPFIGEFDNTADKTNPARRRDLEIAQGVAWLAAQVFAGCVSAGARAAIVSISFCFNLALAISIPLT